MTSVAIYPIPTEKGGLSYRGVAGDKHSEGNTPGEALDALTRQFSSDDLSADTGMLVTIQGLRPDHFFGAVKQKRLAELMGEWRAANDRGQVLPSNKQTELGALVEAELNASARRVTSLADER